MFSSPFYLIVFFSVDFERYVYWSESDGEDWRAPRGKCPPVAKINNSV